MVHARAEQAARDAAARACDAGAAVDRAVEVRTATERDGMDAWLMTWHRSWITRLRLDVTVQQQRALATAAAAKRTAASVQEAHQRRRTLERLRERGLRRYDTDVQRSELKEMNLLAGLRHVARTADEGDSE